MGSQTIPLAELHDEPPQTIAVGALLDAPPTAQSTSGGLVASAASKSVPALKAAAEELATNPGVVRTGQRVGEAIGGVTGLIKGGPLGGAVGLSAGEKTGGILASAAQRIARPLAHILEAVAPYAQTLTTLSGVQSGLDLAQVAEPTRQDIGVLGIGATVPRSDAERAAHPALINLAVQKVSEAVRSLMALGLSQGAATSAVMNAGVKRGQ